MLEKFAFTTTYRAKKHTSWKIGQHRKCYVITFFNLDMTAFQQMLEGVCYHLKTKRNMAISMMDFFQLIDCSATLFFLFISLVVEDYFFSSLEALFFLSFDTTHKRTVTFVSRCSIRKKRYSGQYPQRQKLCCTWTTYLYQSQNQFRMHLLVKAQLKTGCCLLKKPNYNDYFSSLFSFKIPKCNQNKLF